MNRIQAIIALCDAEYDHDGVLSKDLKIQHLDWSKFASSKPKEFEQRCREHFPPSPEQPKYFLIRRENSSLNLVQLSSDSLLSISANFLSPTLNYRRTKGGGKNQLLAKAIGLNRKQNLKVLDATAGLGRDAFILAGLGCSVQMLERVSEVAIILNDALAQAIQHKGETGSDFDSTIERLRLTLGDSHTYIKQLDAETTPDVIYLDPMFPERKKSALVKKEMRVFHDLVGQDDDAAQLLELALQSGAKRIVVKRPRVAPELKPEAAPSHSLAGKSNRYDIYING